MGERITMCGIEDNLLYIGDLDQTSWILTCSGTTTSTINGVVGPFRLVQRGTYRPQASEDVNMHGRYSESNESWASVSYREWMPR